VVAAEMKQDVSAAALFKNKLKNKNRKTNSKVEPSSSIQPVINK